MTSGLFSNGTSSSYSSFVNFTYTTSITDHQSYAALLELINGSIIQLTLYSFPVHFNVLSISLGCPGSGSDGGGRLFGVGPNDYNDDSSIMYADYLNSVDSSFNNTTIFRYTTPSTPDTNTLAHSVITYVATSKTQNGTEVYIGGIYTASAATPNASFMAYSYDSGDYITPLNLDITSSESVSISSYYIGNIFNGFSTGIGSGNSSIIYLTTTASPTYSTVWNDSVVVPVGTGNFNAVVYDFSSNIWIVVGNTLNTLYGTFGTACFLKGTLILTSENKYVEIENLKENDLIKTYKHGDKKIIKIGKSNFKNSYNSNNRDCLYKNKENNLVITGGHSILVEKLSEEEENEQEHLTSFSRNIDDLYKLLSCNSNLFEKVEPDNKLYEIYHICLENEDKDGQYGIWSNNMLAETIQINNFADYF